MDAAQTLRDIFVENQRVADAFNKGTKEVPVIVDPSKLKHIESYVAQHMHDQSGTCIKNIWWTEDGFCHENV